ncbi:MAG: Gfo/Idh/MocA family protein [Chloroflexota bacterium]
MTRIRLGLVDASHLHFRGLIKAALDCPTAQVVGMSIEDAEQRAFYSATYPDVPAFQTAEELYDRGQPEAIITCADNKNAAAVVAAAAARGVHVMKEKPMAATLALADEISTTAARAGVRLMVNWATNWSPAYHHAKRLVDDGRIGHVWQVHHRAGHGGPPPDFASLGPVARVGWGWLIDRARNGGGAYVDFCSYGAVLSRWFMGQPSKVLALGGRYAKDFFTVDDNAILVLGYPRGHSVCEGTWTQPAVPSRIPTMVYGQAGAIAVTGQSELQVAVSNASGERVATNTDVVACPALPEHYRSAPDYFCHCLLHDEPFEGIVRPDLSRDAQEILQAGIESMITGREVGLPLGPYLA